jgi:cell division initiation protein|tara:strand:+ start:153 stop:635 length:483 start_codon:yes stop_codon:yes gene_type:complete
MRFTYLDILEQCFHDKFRGYSKQEVDTFLQLVAEDFKEMTDEMKQLRSDNERKQRKIAKLEDKLQLAEESAKHSNGNGNGSGNGHSNGHDFGNVSAETLKEKAQKIIEKAKEQAGHYKLDAEKELRRLQSEIQHLKGEKKDLLESFKANARNYLQSLQKK